MMSTPVCRDRHRQQRRRVVQHARWLERRPARCTAMAASTTHAAHAEDHGRITTPQPGPVVPLLPPQLPSLYHALPSCMAWRAFHSYGPWDCKLCFSDFYDPLTL